jgi:phosphatidylglycerophosphate synthase
MAANWRDGRKVHPRYCHPLDNAGLAAVNRTCETLHDAMPELTPNMITTAGNVLRFTGLWLLYQRRCAWEAGLFTLLGLVLDFVDGHYARKYDQVTLFGDYYDHVTDWIWAATLGLVVFCCYSRYNLPGGLYCVLVLWLPLYVCHFAAREALREGDGTSSPTVQFTRAALLGRDPEAVALKLKFVNSDFALVVFISGLVTWLILKNPA